MTAETHKLYTFNFTDLRFVVCILKTPNDTEVDFLVYDSKDVDDINNFDPAADKNRSKIFYRGYVGLNGCCDYNWNESPDKLLHCCAVEDEKRVLYMRLRVFDLANEILKNEIG